MKGFLAVLFNLQGFVIFLIKSKSTKLFFPLLKVTEMTRAFSLGCIYVAAVYIPGSEECRDATENYPPRCYQHAQSFFLRVLFQTANCVLK